MRDLYTSRLKQKVLYFTDMSDTREQSDRSKLRSDFLEIVDCLLGEECSIKLYSGFEGKGVFRGSDRDVLHFAFQRLDTPTGVLDAAQLRVTDIDSMKFSTVKK